MSPQCAEECRHFTGVQNDTCAAGVAYREVRDVSQPGMARWSCLTTIGRTPASTTCPSRSLLSRAEQDEKEARIMKAIIDAATAIAAGKCHVCGAAAEPTTRVGRCLYARCGHRIGQALDDGGDE